MLRWQSVRVARWQQRLKCMYYIYWQNIRTAIHSRLVKISVHKTYLLLYYLELKRWWSLVNLIILEGIDSLILVFKSPSRCKLDKTSAIRQTQRLARILQTNYDKTHYLASVRFCPMVNVQAERSVMINFFLINAQNDIFKMGTRCPRTKQTPIKW